MIKSPFCLPLSPLSLSISLCLFISLSISLPIYLSLFLSLSSLSLPLSSSLSLLLPFVSSLFYFFSLYTVILFLSILSLSQFHFLSVSVSFAPNRSPDILRQECVRIYRGTLSLSIWMNSSPAQALANKRHFLKCFSLNKNYIMGEVLVVVFLIRNFYKPPLSRTALQT